MSGGLRCPSCGTPLRPGKRFCSGCGTSISPELQQMAAGPAVTAPPGAPAPQGGPPQAGAYAAAPPGNVLPPGLLVQGRYKVERVLGKGGMGAVYMVRDTKLADRPCAMKEMLDYSRNPEEQAAAVRRFNAEAETLATLSHPGIPQVYDRFVEWSRYYLVMEFVAGVDLSEVLEAHLAQHRTPLPEAEVVRWALQVADILEYLHSHEPPVVHRDLKPANLILTKSGRVKLVDFGIAKAQSATRGTGIGTQGYAPPEQYRGMTEPRSDLYALGATLHHLLTGRDPQLQAPFDFPPLLELMPGASQALATLVDRLLAMKPADRPASAEEVREILTEAFPGVHPYRARASDSRVADLVSHALARKTGVIAPPPPPAAPAAPEPVAAAPPAVTGPQPSLECPVCGASLRPGKQFCTQCGVRVSGTLPQVQARGHSADLNLRVPPGFWERHRVQRIEFQGEGGERLPGVLLGTVPVASRCYAFVVRSRDPKGGSGQLAAGEPVEVFLQEEQGGETVLTAIPAEDSDQVAAVLAAWQTLLA